MADIISRPRNKMKAETELQAELLENWKSWRENYHGLKLSNAYTSGVPDLLLSGDGCHIIEVKKCSNLPIRPNTQVVFDHKLTPIQENALIRLRKGGTWAAWWCVHRNRKDDGIYVGFSLEDIPTQEEFITKCIIRKRGQPWAEVFPALIQWTRTGLPA